MNFSFYIAKRYLKSASKSNAINIINGIASVGIVVGAMALFVVLSVFSGLVNFSLSFSNDFDPDLKITSKIGKSFTISEAQYSKILSINGVSSTSKVVEERVLFRFDGKEKVAYIKGVDSLYKKVNGVKKDLYQGEWLAPKTSQVIVGYGIAQKLSLGLFDFNNPFEVYVPKPGVGALENAFTKSDLIPVGIYSLNEEELDGKYVFADLGLVQELLSYRPNQYSGLEIKLSSANAEQEVIQHLQEILGSQVEIKNRAQLNDSLYKMLNTENVAVYLIFTLVIIIALFNLIGALIMMILDKKSNLKTLYNLGCELKDIRKIFLFQGLTLSIIGGTIGLFLGSIIVLIQQEFQLIMITPSMAYPVVFSLKNIAIVMSTIIALGALASYIASNSVSKKIVE